MPESYRDLIAWQKAKSVALDVYRCTRHFPRAEVYAALKSLELGTEELGRILNGLINRFQVASQRVS
ncbi:MAG TPA: four helix bundle protein [Terriglobales bacterium]